MEISLLRSLRKTTTSLLQLSSSEEGMEFKLSRTYYRKIEEILKFLRPILDAIVDFGIDLDENKQIAFARLCRSLDELREIFGNWEPLMSKVYFVLQAEPLIVKIQTNIPEIIEELRSLDCILPAELNDSSVEHSIQKMKQFEQISPIISKAVTDHAKGFGASSQNLAKITGELSLESNQELLIELVALQQIKENAELAEETDKADNIDQLIGLITHMQGQLVSMKRSQARDPVPIPADFCCPLSLELMTDPVIVASGQTYERAFIQKWFDLGLNVCPKTRQTLAHTILIPNIAVKELISRWDKLTNIMFLDPDPTDSASSNQPSVLLENPDSVTFTRVNTSPDRSFSFLTTTPIISRAISSAAAVQSSLNYNQTDSDNYGGIPLPHHADTYVSDSSGELAITEPQAPDNLVSPRSDGESPDTLETRPFEIRPDLLEVEARVKSLAENLKSDSIEAQRIATADIRLLAKQDMDNRITILNCGVIPLLVGLLRSPDPSVQENSVTALLNLSINDNNKAAIAESGAIGHIIHVLETGTPEARENSAAALFNLSTIEDNRINIGRSGAIKPLADLLGNGTLRGKKDAANALFNLSISHENKGRIVQTDAVKHLVELMDPKFGMVAIAVANLSNLSTVYEGRMAIAQCGGIPELVEALELGSERGKENAAAALLQLCVHSNRYRNMVLKEGAIPPLVTLSRYGTPRAREKSQQLLYFLKDQRR